jgi:hypothetical protein
MLFSPVTYRGRLALLHIRWQHARVRANFKALTDNLLKCARVLQWMPLPTSPESRQSATNAVRVTNRQKYSPHNDSLRDRPRQTDGTTTATGRNQQCVTSLQRPGYGFF